MTATYTYNPGKAHTTANYPLLDNSHYHPTRQGKTPLFCGMHVTAGIDDFDGNDGSAEAAILYGRTTPRPASWWAIVDSDTARDCLPDEYTAFLQGVPDSGYSYNREGWGIEIGARGTDWTSKPAAWVEATLRNAARVIAPRAVRYGWKIKHVTLSELQADLRAGRPSGFIGHAELTPSTRSDPGWVGRRDTFPWEQLLSYVHEEIAGAISDPAVKARQEVLVEAGLLAPTDVDGIDGPKTQAAQEAYEMTLANLETKLDAIGVKLDTHATALDRIEAAVRGIPRAVAGFVSNGRDLVTWMRLGAGALRLTPEGTEVGILPPVPPLAAGDVLSKPAKP